MSSFSIKILDQPKYSVEHVPVVASPDFWSPYTRLGYQFCHVYHSSSHGLIRLLDWKHGLKTAQENVPNSVLIQPDGKTFHSFGYAAETKYKDLASNGEHKPWFFFRRFNMKALFQVEIIDSDMTMKAQNGKELPIMVVLSHMMAYLKDRLMSKLNRANISNVEDNELHWMFTVPVTLNDSVAHFVSSAAKRAGIGRENVTIAKEHETVCAFLKEVAGDMNNGIKGLTIDTFNVDQKFILLNANDDSEISCHEVLSDGKLREICKSPRHEWGYGTVDAEFEELLSQIFGRSVMKIFADEKEEDYLDLLYDFGYKTKLLMPDMLVRLKVPVSLRNIYSNATQRNIKEAIEQSPFADTVKIVTDKLEIKGSVLIHICEKSVKNIISQLAKHIKDDQAADCKTILMVGEFSEVTFLKEKIQQAFPSMTLVTSDSAGLLPLMAAVTYGWNQQAIKHKDLKRYLLVAAIDFGTTFSSWAYQYTQDYDANPMKIFAKTWNSSDNISNKAPTTVLIKPDGHTLHSFGYDAENKFTELASEDEHEPWFYFRRFKMKLFQAEHTHTDMMIEAQNGKELPALLVFSLVIDHLRKDLKSHIQNQLTKGGIFHDDVQWVLTVPAIWNEGAKQFMRQAAIQAGIEDDDLLIALEPEAASIFCKQLALDPQSGMEGTTVEMFTPEQVYLVLDCGGGTIDINVHEVLPDKNLRELHKPTGNNCGGTTVDKAFEAFLTEILGRSVMKSFQREHLDDYLTLYRDFEIKKRMVSLKEDKNAYFNLPLSVMDSYKNHTGKELKHAFAQSKYADGVGLFKTNKLKVTAVVMRSFFVESIKGIKDQLETLLQDKRLEACKTILIVGGYGECDILREEVKMKFSHIDVVTPVDAGLAVLKGAVLFGRNRHVIASRVCKYTYGLRAIIPYDPRIHPIRKKFIDVDGKAKVSGSFSKLTEAEQEVSPCIPYKGTLLGKSPGDSTSRVLTLVASTKKDPIFTDEPGCFTIGSFEIDHTDKNGKISKVKPLLLFGGTDIEMLVVYETTGEEKKATFRLPD